MSRAALYAGIAVANAGAGAVHALAYPLGGRIGVPHGIANAILLPHVLEQNMATCPESYAALCDESDTRSAQAKCGDVLATVQELLRTLKTPARLVVFGVQGASLPALAEEAFTIRRLLENNARDFGPEEVLAVYQAAW